MELNNESKTLFIPLYGKAMMSKNNLFINDPKAEEIISKVKFNFEDLKQSKWLSMYMALRAKIIDEICNRYITQNPNTTVIHLGCGLDSRCLRVDNNNISWYDIDFQSVIDLRKQFYKETEKYKMIGKSVTDLSWLDEIDLDNQSVLIVAEGYDYYIDDGFSGTDFSRPAFERLLNDLYEKKFNTLIVKDLSRLGRNYIEVGNYIEKIFPLFNIRFIAINDQIDSIKNPESVNSVIVPFKNLLNDEYCRDISNKIKEVLNVKMKKGEYVGSYAPYGYLKDPKDIHHLIIDKEAAKIVKLIFEWTLSGLGRTAIAKKLNELGILNPTGHRVIDLKVRTAGIENKNKIKYTWSSSTVRQILNNEMYCGDVVQHKGKLISYKIHKRVLIPKEEWVVVRDVHEPIIDRETFDRVKKEIDDSDFVERRKKFLELNINKCEEQINIKRNLRKEAYEDWKLGNITEEEYNEYTKEYGEQIRQFENNINKYYDELKNFTQASSDNKWIEHFKKYKNVNSLSRELIDNLIDNIYVYEDKKIRIKFKYEDEYNYLMEFIKERKKFIS